MYITFEEYTELYEPMEERLFCRLAFEACRIMDNHTTGIGNVKKLQKYFPQDPYNAKAVKFCAAKIIDILFQIQEVEASSSAGRGYTETENGMQRKVISAIQSGSESITFSEAKATNTTIDVAAADKKERDRLIVGIIRESLSGVTDANGVNLLYMGVYPRV